MLSQYARIRGAIAVSIVGLCIAACDQTTSSEPSQADPKAVDAWRQSGGLTPFVVMGVSIEEGRQSNGLLAASQRQAWPAQLARLMHISFSQPLIGGGGCPSPSIAPLIAGAVLDPDAGCADNLPGVVLPANDVALTFATTHDALYTTPESAAAFSEFRGLRYSRILPQGQTQVTAMLSQHPRLVMLDLGGAELVPALFGSPAFVTPYDEWQQDYDQVIKQVRSTGAKGVLVWYSTDPALLAGERRGIELWEDRAEFAAEGVTVPDDCRTTGRDNLVYVADFVLNLVESSQSGDPAPVLSCTDLPDDFDDVLTPAELATVRADARRREMHVRELARQAGFGFFKIEDVLFRRPDFKPRFSISRILHSNEPYGRFMSLDDLHPNAAGHAIIAQAAQFELLETLNSAHH